MRTAGRQRLATFGLLTISNFVATKRRLQKGRLSACYLVVAVSKGKSYATGKS